MICEGKNIITILQAVIGGCLRKRANVNIMHQRRTDPCKCVLVGMCYVNTAFREL